MRAARGMGDAPPSGPLPGAPGSRAISQFSVGAGQVMSILRLPLIVLVALIGLAVPRERSNPTLFLAIWIPFAVWSLGVSWWMYHRPVPHWSSWVTTFVDLGAFVGLAATSSGATSYIGPVFYLYPIAVAFQYRPRLTAAVGFSIAGTYVISWLPRLGRAGGPDIPLVVWLYAGLLLWLATACTALTTFLVRRSEYVLQLLTIQQQLTAETLAVADRERARLAEDLHDGALQNIIAVRRNLEDLAEEYPGSALLAQSDALLRDIIQALRGTVTTLHPQVLAQLGLTQALHELLTQYTDRSGFSVHASLADVGQTPAQSLLYGTARELLANITKHAHASNVWITLSTTADSIGLDVADDGTGFDPSTVAARVATGHIGLASHSIRVADLGGSLSINRYETSGTRVSVRIPLPQQRATTD